MPYHYACFMGRSKCVAALIRAGCDTTSRVKVFRDKRGRKFLSGTRCPTLRLRFYPVLAKARHCVPGHGCS